MPQPKKPPDKLQRRNKPKVIESPVGVAAVYEEPPLAPPELSEELLDEWVDLWSSELALTWDRKSDLAGLRRLFRMRQMVEGYELSVFSNSTVYDADMKPIDMVPLVQGSTGQMVVNPLLKECSDLRKQILALEDRFGLSPAARLKLGIALGDAQRSLGAMNASLTAGFQGARNSDEVDPRLNAIDAKVV
jgi:hypothetical protein